MSFTETLSKEKMVKIAAAPHFSHHSMYVCLLLHSLFSISDRAYLAPLQHFLVAIKKASIAGDSVKVLIVGMIQIMHKRSRVSTNFMTTKTKSSWASSCD
jgi:hypothetical protein